MLRRRRLKSLCYQLILGAKLDNLIYRLKNRWAVPTLHRLFTENRKPQLNNPGHQEIAVFPGRGIFQDRVQRQACPDLVLPEDVE